MNRGPGTGPDALQWQVICFSEAFWQIRTFIFIFITIKKSPRSRFWWNAMITTQYCDVIMDALASQITSLTIVYSTLYSDADQRKHQSSASLAFVWGIHRGPVNSPHKWPVTRKIFPFDDVKISIGSWAERYMAVMYFMFPRARWSD